ncbi:Site-specific DNA recombinase [Atopomonas hussainii]|uniref:Site-specific DNA recombinase n=1 Tax=Atopomonas hussainii TaxID=1429083 RepID=A0A1H7SS36_9GAMM|nr:recombinase family protein [Atopomonas hussainii]SEL74327.1 Site-specific DNA recombinase [Atopomonas hussainii]
MFIRAYLRASTSEQDSNRARSSLAKFAEEKGKKVAAYYVENESGASLQRPELFRLLDEAHAGDVLLVEQVDRLSRLTESDWQSLRAAIKAKQVKVVALDLPTSHQFLSDAETATDAFTSRMLAAVNDMMLDMLAAVARKDYEDRRRRQNEGIAKAKEKGAYKGRGIDKEKHARILKMLGDGYGIRETAQTLQVSTSTVLRARDRAK